MWRLDRDSFIGLATNMISISLPEWVGEFLGIPTRTGESPYDSPKLRSLPFLSQDSSLVAPVGFVSQGRSGSVSQANTKDGGSMVSPTAAEKNERPGWLSALLRNACAAGPCPKGQVLRPEPLRPIAIPIRSWSGGDPRSRRQTCRVSCPEPVPWLQQLK